MKEYKERLNLYRESYSPKKLLDFIRKFRRCFNSGQIGSGKSYAISKLIQYCYENNEYDLVIYFAAQHSNIEEQWKPDDPRTFVHLKGKSYLNGFCNHADDIEKLDNKNLRKLVPETVCSSCKIFKTCEWRESPVINRGVSIIYAAVDHLRINSNFVKEMMRRVSAKRCLVLFDEDKILDMIELRKIRSAHLDHHIKVLQDITESSSNENLLEQKKACETLQMATTADLRKPGWKIPESDDKQYKELQLIGYKKFKAQFKFLGYDLQSFSRSDRGSRNKDTDGTITFLERPNFRGCDVMIFSALADSVLINSILGERYREYSCGKFPRHPETEFYNLATYEGSKHHYFGNSERLSNVFSQLIAKDLEKGLKVLLVASKELIQKVMIPVYTKKLRELGMGKYSIKWIKAADSREFSDEKNVLPIINYGIIGVNCFEDYDCAYCLNSFFIGDTLTKTYQKHLPLDQQIAIDRTYPDVERMRYNLTFKVEDMPYPCINKILAARALYRLEIGCILQALGRIRPWSTKCKVFMFHPYYVPKYFRNFRKLDEVKKFFDLSETVKPKKKKPLSKKQNEICYKYMKYRGDGMRAECASTKVGTPYQTISRWLSRYQSVSAIDF